MIIAVASSNKNIDSKVSGVFGKAPFIFLADTESRIVKILDISKIAALPYESGKGAAELLIRIGTDRLAAVSIEEEPREILAGKGITVFSGVSGTAREVIDRIATGGRIENK